MEAGRGSSEARRGTEDVESLAAVAAGTGAQTTGRTVAAPKKLSSLSDSARLVFCPGLHWLKLECWLAEVLFFFFLNIYLFGCAES